MSTYETQLYLLRSDTASLAWAKERMIEAADEIERLCADNARLEALRQSMRDELLRGRAYDERAEAIRDELVAALEGVIRVADRKTDEFDAARAALAKAKGEDK